MSLGGSALSPNRPAQPSHPQNRGRFGYSDPLAGGHPTAAAFGLLFTQHERVIFQAFAPLALGIGLERIVVGDQLVKPGRFMSSRPR